MAKLLIDDGNLKEILNAYALQNPEIDINIITPNEKYIKKFIALV